MPRALAAAVAPACSGSHNAVPQARGMTAIAIGSRLHAERVISRSAENVIPDPAPNQLLAFFRMSNDSLGMDLVPERTMVHRRLQEGT